MKDLLEKLSSYNIFNYLFPGILVAVLSTAVSSFDLLADDIVVGVFLYYFYGLVVSRIGSLVLEPIMKRIRVVRFAPYADFVAASRIDEKIDMLSEQNNVYRTLASAFLCLTLLGPRKTPSALGLSCSDRCASALGSLHLVVPKADELRVSTG